MLRALAGYFFGGPQDEVPLEQVECETKEVNDWLVVNMPDQPEDEIDFEENDDENEMNVENEMDVEDLDDVLWCLSNWFAAEEEFEREPALEESEIVEVPSMPQIRLLFNDLPNVERKCISINFTGRIDTVPRPHRNSFWHLIPLQMRYKKLEDDLRASVARLNQNAASPDALWVDQKMRQLAYDNLTGKQKGRDLFLRLKEKAVKTRGIKSSDVTCHPVYSKTYVNHRHPTLSPPKTDLLQKIKELEPEQRATQHAMKKHMSRGQINRQNKNYIYDTSTKKNRRKNLQRNPSGANNNRKCCY